MNQNTNICPLCSQNTKIVPPGVSKRTGKAYASFISCTSRDCKFTDSVPAVAAVPTIPEGTPTGTEVPPETPKTEGISEVLAAQRTLYKKIDDIETKLIDKTMQFDDFKDEIKELLKEQ